MAGGNDGSMEDCMSWVRGVIEELELADGTYYRDDEFLIFNELNGGMALLIRGKCIEEKGLLVIAEVYGALSAFHRVLGEKIGEFYDALLRIHLISRLNVVIGPNDELIFTVSKPVILRGDEGEGLDEDMLLKTMIIGYLTVGAWLIYNYETASETGTVAPFDPERLKDIIEEFKGGDRRKPGLFY